MRRHRRRSEPTPSPTRWGCSALSVLLFPDNTVLINFALISRMDLLGRLAHHGSWCATVASECDRSAQEPGLGALSQAREIFGEPLRPDDAELLDARVLRQELAMPGDGPFHHLGEAETLAIVIRRQLTAIFVTDDKDATRLATNNSVTVVSTWMLLRVAHRQGWVDADTLWGYVQTLQAGHRSMPPDVRDRPSFDKWLEA